MTVKELIQWMTVIPLLLFLWLGALWFAIEIWKKWKSTDESDRVPSGIGTKRPGSSVANPRIDQ